MGKVRLLILKVKNMKVIGGMTKLKVMEFILILIVLNMKENGTKTYNMEKGQKNGRMALCLVENIGMVRRMA